jgi:phenylacetate-coenzyme A ligase PaaK-like adenylate-forming protein
LIYNYVKLRKRLNTFKNFTTQLYALNEQSFDNIALSLFRYQANNNPVYRDFISNLNIDPQKIHSLQEIPFLPISFFKSQKIKTGNWEQQTSFSSSGTTGMSTSTHLIYNLDFYLQHAERCFKYFFGELSDYHFLALLPSYLERSDSSLVAMMDHFIKQSESPYSGFYLNNLDKLLSDLEKLKKEGKKTILWGVTFALLDLAEKEKPDLSHCIIFETGGMKGRRKEITREELHAILYKGFNVNSVFSEYGMTELLSQSYSKGKHVFYCPPWTKMIGRDITDPFQKGLLSETCGINIIDLANWHSTAFIETEDLGKVHPDGSFEVLGRMDNSDVRGCNLMVE